MGVCMAIPWAHDIEAWGGHGRAKGGDREVGTAPYMKEAPSLSLYAAPHSLSTLNPKLSP